MSSIDDIDDEVVVAPVQTTSLWARKKQQRELEEAQKAEKAVQILSESFQQSDPSNNNINIATDNDGNTVKTSNIFNRLQKKLDLHKEYLPKTHTDELPPRPIEPIDITKPFYGITVSMSCSEMDLELIRLVAFYRAAVGHSFDKALNQRLKKRQYDVEQKAMQGIKAGYDVSFERLPFLQIQHSLYPLLVQYTQIYRHILDTMQKDDEILQNLIKRNENVETSLDLDNNDDDSSSNNNNNNNDINELADSIVPDNRIETPISDPQNPQNQQNQQNEQNQQNQQNNRPLTRMLIYEQKLIDNMPKPPLVPISLVLKSQQDIVNQLISHAQHNYRDILIAFHEKIKEQIEFEAVAAIDWNIFSIIDQIDFPPITQSTLHTNTTDDLMLPMPCSNVADLKALFTNQEKYEKVLLAREKADIDAQLARKNISDIDDIDDDINSYLESSRGGLTGYAAGESIDGIDDHAKGSKDNKNTGTKRQRPFNTHDDDEEELDLVTLSAGSFTSSGGEHLGNNSNIMTAKCEICGQQIAINELAQHMKMELANPDWRSGNNGAGRDQRAIMLGDHYLNSTGIVSGSMFTGTTPTNNLTTDPTVPQNTHPTPQAPVPPQQSQQQQKTLQAPLQPSEVFTQQYMQNKHNEFLSKSGQNPVGMGGVPLPPGLAAPPLPPGLGGMGMMGDNAIKRPYNDIMMDYNNPNNQLVSLQQQQQQQNMPPGMTMLQHNNINQQPQQQQQQQQPANIQIQLINLTHNQSKMISYPSNKLIILEEEKPLTASSITPSNWENICMYEENLYLHEFTITIPDLTKDQNELATKHNFLGQSIVIKLPTLRISVGEFKSMIQNEILNRFDKRIKLNTTTGEGGRGVIFLNNDNASLAAYQLKHGYGLVVSLQKFAGGAKR